MGCGCLVNGWQGLGLNQSCFLNGLTIIQDNQPVILVLDVLEYGKSEIHHVGNHLMFKILAEKGVPGFNLAYLSRQTMQKSRYDVTRRRAVWRLLD